MMQKPNSPRPMHISAGAMRPVKRSSIISGSGEWWAIDQYVRQQADLLANMCFGCGKGMLHDKNGGAYELRRSMRLAEVEAIAQHIRKINESE